MTRISHNPIAHLALIALLGAALYAGTLESPMLWDDKSFVAGNPVVMDLGYFAGRGDVSKLKRWELDGLRRRYAGYLSFALDYRVHGAAPFGYHVVNTTIHIANAWLVYWLALILSARAGTPGSGAYRLPALLAGALFVSHPLQTEAVTYIFQRLASLCAMFYLLAAASYAASLKAGPARKKHALYIVALASALLAMKTKENAFSLPFVIAMIDLVLAGGGLRQRAPRLLPFALTLAIIPMSLGGGVVRDGPPAAVMGFASAEDYGSLQYALTQLQVLAMYLRLLVLPVGQSLDHQILPVLSPREGRAVLGAIALAALLITPTVWVCRTRQRAHASTVALFGALWFLMASAVESSIVPIPMLIDEYRAYLPSAGLIIAASTLMAHGIGRFDNSPRRMAALAGLACAVALMATATVHRNSVWRSPVALWSDVVNKSPQRIRGYVNLANALRELGRTDEAIGTYERALATVHPSLGKSDERPELHYNLAGAYEEASRPDEAEKQYRAALALAPQHLDARNNLALIYAARGQEMKALSEYRIILSYDPLYAPAYFNMAEAYENLASKGASPGHNLSKARENYGRFLALVPGHAQAIGRLRALGGGGGRTI